MPPIDPRKSQLSTMRSLPFSATTRRRFLQGSAAAISGAILSNCARNLADVNGSGGSPSAGQDNTLYIYTWSTYVSDAVLKDFTEVTGFKAIADIFDSNESMLAKMQAGGGRAYSIIYPSDYMVQQLLELDMLAELDASRIEGLDNLFDNWQNPAYDPNNQHSVPYAWGTTGLIYNSKQVNPAPEDWDYLWNQKSKLSRRITLLNDMREVMGATLKSLGYSYNSTNPQEIEAAYQRLVELKPALASFTTDGWRDQIVTGDLLMAMVYSVDAIDAIDANSDLQYIVPSSGASLWTDTMVIPKSAPNVEAAYAWINYIYQPENSAKVVDELKFATPNKAALDLVSNDLKNNRILFPPETILSRCEGIAPIGNAAELYDKYWTQLTSA